MVPGDVVDRVIRGWSRARPDLDVRPIGVVARLQIVRARFDKALQAVFARFGLSDPEFAVLATLVRLGGEAPQRRLVAELDLSPGTVSVRVDALEAAGLAVRAPDPGDRRGAVVSITDAGRRAFDACAPEHLANERRLLSALTPAEQETLANLLRKLVLSFDEQPHVTGVARELGLDLAPAHAALEMRRAVGLSERPGLLVRDVIGGTPAAEADLRRGDLLVEADGLSLRSIADLYAAVHRRRRHRDVDLGLLRGSRRRTERVRIPAAARHASS
jgi:DNA-binding MarR family transcriptional regulator